MATRRTLEATSTLLQMSKGAILRAISQQGLAVPKSKGRYQFSRKHIRAIERHRDAKSKSAWRSEGRRVKRGAKPIGYRSGRIANRKQMKWDIYAFDQTSPRPLPSPPVEIGILLAVWLVNRYAKRCREAAKASYAKRSYSLATIWKKRKERMYQMKSLAIHYLTGSDLVRSGYHRFANGLWSLLLSSQDGKYRFHQPCAPVDGVTPTQLPMDEIEAKPSGSEGKLRDAVHTLETYLRDKEKVHMFKWPIRQGDSFGALEDSFDTTSMGRSFGKMA